MQKFALMTAALATIVIAAPTIASAETIVIKRAGQHHGYNHHGARAQMQHDRGYHRGWRHGHRDRVAVIKKRYHRH